MTTLLLILGGLALLVVGLFVLALCWCAKDPIHD